MQKKIERRRLTEGRNGPSWSWGGNTRERVVSGGTNQSRVY